MPVVEGEDTESDVDSTEEHEQEESVGGTMVSGEASETDEEDAVTESEPVAQESPPQPQAPSKGQTPIRERFKSLTKMRRKRSSDGVKRRVHHDPRFDS